MGSSGVQVSIIGLGGGHIASSNLSLAESVRIIHRAVDEGITFFDNAWEYYEGKAESLMGKALSGKRDKVFLMTKVCARDRRGAESDLHDSLRRLRTDHIDLWQFHEIDYGNDAEWIFAPGGAAEAAEAALKTGKVRFVGFTGHKDPEFLLKMLECDFPWAAAQFPVTVVDVHFKSFIKRLIPELRKRQISGIGMKSLGGSSELVLKGGIPAELCRRYALSQDIATLVCGIDSMEVLDQDIEVAKNFVPMSREEQDALTAQTKNIGGDGRYEVYKTTQNYDSGTHRTQHLL